METLFLHTALPAVDRAALARLLREATALNGETSLPLHDALVALADAVEHAPTEDAATDERTRFITANAELGLLTVRQGYALRVLRDAATAALEASQALCELKGSVTPEAGGPDLDVNAWVRNLRTAEGRASEATKALRTAVAEGEAEAKAAEAAHVHLVAERDRLQRACDEGLPREAIFCPACGKRHVEWFRHDAPGIDGRKRPHHTHRCYHCTHVWDSGRWSFGVAEGQETVKAPPPNLAAALEALKPLASRAYRSITLAEGDDREAHFAAPIHPDYGADNHESPRLVLALDLGGMQFDGEASTPWQASVEYEGDMGIVPIDAGNACATPLEALVSLRESMEAERDTPSDDEDDDGPITEATALGNPCHGCGAEPGEACEVDCEVGVGRGSKARTDGGT